MLGVVKAWTDVPHHDHDHDNDNDREAVEFLANEGHIYTTTDESHYKATG